MKQQKHPSQPKPGAERQSRDDRDDRVKPNRPVLPSESAVGEEDPGDFENASIRRDDGHRNPDPAPSRER
ncbi:hypothetical protein PQH03_02825 [Ralstonia insidiosa]|jgi:hypothetical protein|uniref:hypothetical protein n=1 Tax=Ralstonia TaxID=48736 RepID=UPI000664A944|nr:hypothetical protein [Ralstonia insidiosa]KMW46595.1 hypothetical protein AC240_15235 [Ralstonia sp. MD27]MBX3771688.1 hypothetical protein [Ralstonia pickettii]MBA9855787.1 hypothetical protein [Ralstonia insidiosa]MBA9868730.1 hypothetical protein [Ralstonia insidiosa]MBA9912563.1 hypothetical protein [Ralstonia insidiosa]